MVRVKEEEIKEVLENVVRTNKYSGLYTTVDVITDAIQGLLDLYEKEKEKNIYLTQELETRKWVKVKENGEVEPAFYISKDKIRELAKKYEYVGNGYDCTTASYKESQDIGRYIAYLELLKEE